MVRATYLVLEWAEIMFQPCALISVLLLCWHPPFFFQTDLISDSMIVQEFWGLNII